MNEAVLIALVVVCLAVGYQQAVILGLEKKQDFDHRHFVNRIRKLEDELWGRWEVCGDIDTLLPESAGGKRDSEMATAAGVWGSGAGGEE